MKDLELQYRLAMVTRMRIFERYSSTTFHTTNSVYIIPITMKFATVAVTVAFAATANAFAPVQSGNVSYNIYN